MNERPDFDHVRATHMILVLLAALSVATALAQDAVTAPNEPSSAAETDRIIVTGSYTPTQTAAEVGPNPIQVIDRETIKKSGQRNTEQLCAICRLRTPAAFRLPGPAGRSRLGKAPLPLPCAALTRATETDAFPDQPKLWRCVGVFHDASQDAGEMTKSE